MRPYQAIIQRTLTSNRDLVAPIDDCPLSITAAWQAPNNPNAMMARRPTLAARIPRNLAGRTEPRARATNNRLPIPVIGIAIAVSAHRRLISGADLMANAYDSSGSPANTAAARMNVAHAPIHTTPHSTWTQRITALIIVNPIKISAAAAPFHPIISVNAAIACGH